MIARKNPSTGKWDAQYSYTDWQGKRKKTTKRGFRTKREAVEWYDHFRATQDADFNMVFKDFIEIYMEDQSHRLRQHTMMNKRFLFDKHIIPYFGNKKVNAIKAPDIRAWQNKLMVTGLKPTYLKTINNQLNAVFNYAMKYTELAETAKQCLIQYANGFQARNPTLRVFWSHLHMDEATPHVHIDFVPYITGSKRGMDTRVSLKQALSQLGFKGGTRSATEWNQWAQSEKQVLAEIMLEHGIEWEQLGTHEEHLSVLDYKKQERAKEVRALDTTIAEKHTQVDEIEQTLQSVQKQVIDINKIENISVKKALLSDKVTLPRNDFENLLNAAKQYVVYRRQDDRLQGLLDAANAKIMQLESVVGELKRKVSGLVDELNDV